MSAASTGERGAAVVINARYLLRTRARRREPRSSPPFPWEVEVALPPIGLFAG